MDNTTVVGLAVPDILYDLSCVYLVGIGFAGAFLNTTSLVRLFKAIKVSCITFYSDNTQFRSYDDKIGIPNSVL